MSGTNNSHIYPVTLFGKANRVLCKRDLSAEEQQALRQAAELITGEDSGLLIGFDLPDLTPLYHAKTIFAAVARASAADAAGTAAADELAEVLKQAAMVAALVTMPASADLKQLETALVPLTRKTDPAADIRFGSCFGEGPDTEIVVLAVPSV